MKQARIATFDHFGCLKSVLFSCLLPAMIFCQPGWGEEASEKSYDVIYSGTFRPERGVAEARIEVKQSGHLLKVLDMNAPESEFSGATADGELERNGDRLIWYIPPAGGNLKYEVRTDHERSGLMDARMTKDWAILRLDDVFPSARVRSRIGAESHSRLNLKGPPGWQFESRYKVTDGIIWIDDPQRRFDRPTGWMVAGKLGIRRENITHRRVSIAAPEGQGMRRMDIAAFLRWTLPKLVRVFPGFPGRLLIVGARDGMWHGGLSGPGSLYLYSGRPLISENATSALLHELVHVATSAAAVEWDDWITEGLAEYYSLEILRRSGGIDNRRFQRSLQQLASWSEREGGRLRSPSTGADTAKAVAVFDMIQKELADHDAGSLDSVVRQLLEAGRVDGVQLLRTVESALGGPSDKLRRELEKPKDRNP